MVENLYFDRQISTLMALAKHKYKTEVKSDPELKKFKNGSIVFKKQADDIPNCFYQVIHKEKKSNGQGMNEVHYKISLKIGEKASNSEQIRFTVDDTVNISGLKAHLEKVISDQSKLLNQTNSFLEVVSQPNLK